MCVLETVQVSAIAGGVQGEGTRQFLPQRIHLQSCEPPADTYSSWLIFASQHLFSRLRTPWECSCLLLFVPNNLWLGNLSSKVYSAFLLQLSPQMFHFHLSDNIWWDYLIFIHTLRPPKKANLWQIELYSTACHSPINGLAAGADGLGRPSKHHCFSQLLSLHTHHYEPSVTSYTLASWSVFSNCQAFRQTTPEQCYLIIRFTWGHQKQRIWFLHLRKSEVGGQVRNLYF